MSGKLHKLHQNQFKIGDSYNNKFSFPPVKRYF